MPWVLKRSMVEIFARIATQNGFIPIAAKTPLGDLLV